MANPVDPVLQGAFERSRAVSLNNQTVRLTPEGVTTFDYSVVIPPAWKPGLLSPHMAVAYKKDRDCRPFYVREWVWKDRDTGKIQRWSSGIYAGGVQFPRYCVACLKAAEHFEVVQVLDPKDVAIGRQRASVDSQEEANRLSEAFTSDRYWFAVPYCRDHGLQSKAMFIRYGGSEFTFGFLQPEYGREFASLNRLRAVWLSKSFLFRTKLLHPFLLAVAGLSAFSGLVLAVRGFKGGLGSAPAHPTDIPVGVALVVTAIVVGVVVIRLILRSEAESKAGES